MNNPDLKTKRKTKRPKPKIYYTALCPECGDSVFDGQPPTEEPRWITCNKCEER